MHLVEHAEYELKLGGFKIDDEQDLAGKCGKSALELIKVFEAQNHSDFSAKTTLQIFDRLVKFKPLTNTLSDNPNEWVEINLVDGDDPVYQSKRNCSCFSHDLKTYYDIDDPENNIYEMDEKGNKNGYCRLKPLCDRKLVELVHVES